MAYKMIIDGSIVDADTTPCYARYNAKIKAFLACDAEHAQFVSSRNGDQWWHISGTPTNGMEDCQTVDLVETDTDEASALMDAFDAKREPIKIELPPEEPIEEEEEVVSDNTIAILRQHTSDLMMQAYEEVIQNGFDVVLSDGETHHFALSHSDQLNLISLYSMRAIYPDGIYYQADGEELSLYSDEDFEAIFYGASACRAKHYVYAQKLCAYVNTLETLSDLQGVFYGMEIPETHQTDKSHGGRKK